MSHVLSILVLLLRLRVTKNAIGISIKTQELYLVVFVTRYLDLFTTYYSLYNTLMKILYISATAFIIYMVKGTEPFKTTYEKAHDSFLHWKFAVLPCVALALVTNYIQGFNIMEVDSFAYCLCFFYAFIYLVVLDLFDLFGSACHSTSTYPFAKVQRSRKSYWSLCLSPGNLSSTVHRELDLPLLP